MNRRPFNIAALASFVFFILSAGTLLANICWGHRYGYVGRRPQYVIAMDELSLIVQRQDGTFTVKIPLLVSTVLFALLPAVWYDRRERRRQRLFDGQCPACAYDMRATSGWCPECGTTAPIAGQPGSQMDVERP